MHSSHSRPNGHVRRYSGKSFSIPVNFVCLAPEARHVSLLGDFNDWQPAANPMKRQADGAWSIQVRLPHGHHHYVFLVDGQNRLDPKAQGIGRNGENEKVSMVAVS